MKKQKRLPKTYEELKSMSNDSLDQLWDRYFDTRPGKQRQSMLRPLWHKIACEDMNLKIKQKHITKLNRYSTNPEQHIEKSYKTKYHLKKGIEIVKTYKSRTFRVRVVNESTFIYSDKVYRSLSAVAKAICNKKVSGYDFFGLNNKRVDQNIVRVSNE